MTFAIDDTLLLTASFLLLGLGVIALLSKPRRRSDVLFFAFVIALLGWNIGNFLIDFTDAIAGLPLFAGRVTAIAMSWAPWLFLLFIVSFGRDNERLSKVLVISGSLAAAVFTFLGFTPLIVEDVDTSVFPAAIVRGSLYNVLILHIVVFVVLSIAKLVRRYWYSHGREKIQLLYFVIGIGVMAFIALTTNVFLVQIFGDTRFVRFGPIAPIVLVLAVFYAITYHHLMNIRVIAAQLFVGALWVFTFVQTLTAPFGSNEQIVNGTLFIFVIIVGALLLRSVMKEVRQREHIEKLAEDLRAANNRLAEMDKIKSEFLNIASHQLYTPMTAIRGYVSMMSEGEYGKIPKKQQPIIDILMQASDKLITLIRDLLDVSRIEEGRLQLSLESLDLVNMAKELVTELQPNIQKKGLKLTLHKPKTTIPHVVADAQRIRQVLLNIIDNAVKYTEKGSIHVRVARDGDDLVFSVEDTGMGMTQKEVDVLFTKFTRVGGKNKYRTEGSGLGLYVARQIVQEHNGDIWVESSGMGKGSTFFVKLPVESSPESLEAGENVMIEIQKAGEAHDKEDPVRK